MTADTIPQEHVEQVARYMQARDAREYGHVLDGVLHPTWEESGELGKQDYLRDAYAFLSAANLLGYRTGPLDLTQVNRLELIGPAGRVIGFHSADPLNVALHVQDDGLTLKVLFNSHPV